jgi:exocyst complex component 4
MMPGPYTNGNGYHGNSLSPDFRDQRSQSRPNEFDRRRGRQPSYNSGRSESRGRGAQAERQVDDVLDYMKQDWRFMIGDDCLPSYTALQFLDDSSLGLAHRYEEFYNAHQQLQSALRAIVNGRTLPSSLLDKPTLTESRTLPGV